MSVGNAGEWVPSSRGRPPTELEPDGGDQADEADREPAENHQALC